MTRFTVLFVCSIAVSLVFAGVSGAAIDPDTLVGMWSLNEGSGDVAADSSGKGNDGTLTNGPVWVDNGYSGKALEFTGVSNHVLIPDSDSLDGDEITVAAWVNPSSLEGTWNIIASKWFEGDMDWHFALKLLGDVYKLNLFLTNEFDFFGESAVSAGEWSHCAFTLNSSGDIALYLNGQLDGSKAGTGGKIAASTSVVQISDMRGSHFGMIGLIDEVAIYNVALSQDDIGELMQGTAAVSAAGKLATTWADIKN